MNTLAERLIYLMDNCNINQTEFAAKIGISKQSLYKYIHCKCEPRAEIIARMAMVLNTSADFIVGITNDYTPVKRDLFTENAAKREVAVLSKFKKLSEEDKIRIEERIDVLLENENMEK